MEQIGTYAKFACAVSAALLTHLYGGFDSILSVLVALVVFDYLTGILGAIYQKQLSSEAGYRGIIKKVGLFIAVSVAHLLGYLIHTPEIRSAVIGFYIANEGFSILENLGKMGLPLPSALRNVLVQLKNEDGGKKE